MMRARRIFRPFVGHIAVAANLSAPRKPRVTGPDLDAARDDPCEAVRRLVAFIQSSERGIMRARSRAIDVEMATETTG